jgi:pimeloyl-ACP methyl ester carboxylesterase
MQDLTIYNKCNEKLSAYLYNPLANGKYMLVICHGFRGAKENGGKIFAFAEKLQKLEMGVLAFDFRGSGQSEGDFASITLSRQADDLQQIIDYVHTQYSLPIILLGRSFGGSTILAGGSGDPRIAGYILWSTPVLMQQTFSAILPNEYRLMEQGNTVKIKDESGEYVLQPELVTDFYQHKMDAYLRNIGIRPVLIIHARDDEAVDPSNALYMQERLPNSCLHIVDNAGHRFLDKIAEREGITIDWLMKTFEL